MEKFSVKKPYTILVMVIMILALGFVSVTRMTTELLPDFSIPYMLVITTYAGASPETVEAGVTEPLESELGTITGVENVYSYSMENYSMIQLEFEDDTDMDSALVKISSAINEIESSLPDEAGTPLIMELSMDMIASMYIGVGYEGYDEYELTDYVSTEVIPYLERQEGVASVSSVGLVEETVVVELNEDKIDDLNDEILAEVNEELADAKEALDEAQAQVDEALEAIADSESTIADTISSSIFDSLTPTVDAASESLVTEIASLQAQITALQSAAEALQDSSSSSSDTVSAAVESAAQAAAEAAVSAGSASLTASVNQVVADSSDEISALANAMAQDAAEAMSEALADSLTESLTAVLSDSTVTDTISSMLSSYLMASMTGSSASISLTDEQTAALNSTLTQIMTDAATDAASAAVSSVASSMSSSETAALEAALAAGLTAAVSDAADAAVSAAVTSVSASASALESSASSSSSSSVSLDDIISQLEALNDQLDEAIEALGSVSGSMDTIEEVYSTLTEAQLAAAVELATYSVQLTEAQTTLAEAQDTYEEQREVALESANLDSLLTLETLAALVYAQNFSMPAGYIDDEDDNSWLLKIGDEFEDADDISEVLLVDNDTIGTIRLSDVADITVIDNADDSYAKLNGEDGIVLMISKSSTAGTNAVSEACNTALEELAEEDEGFTYMILMDQGVYIDLIVESVLMSILLGGILAIIVLALFLKDVKPTLVVAVSIPLSVLLALVLMYFTGLELNMMTLSGLALGIGMLVDNSIVVLENILRLRNTGMSAPRAAVQGAKQVRSAITASTLTTICVFLPVVFTNGTVRTLLVPLALSIGYCLMASLLIALTVVPATTSTIFRDIKPKQYKLMDRIQDKYEKSLRWCLDHKAIPLGGAVALLAVTVYAITQMGIVFFPDITTTAVQVTIETPETDTRDQSYAKVDQILDAILEVDGIEDVGVMSSSSTTSMLGVSLTSDDSSYGSYICYVAIPDDTSAKEAANICDRIEFAVNGIDAEVTAASSGMSDMSSLMSSSGLTVNIYGEDLDTLTEISGELQELIAQTEGFEEITDGTEEGEETLHLVIDKDQAMSYGLTVAQIYTEIATAMTTSTVSTTVWIDSVEIDVEIVDETDTLTVENLMDLEFEITSTDDTTTTDSSVDLSALTGSSDEEDGEDAEEEDDGIVTLGEIAELETTTSLSQIDRENQVRYLAVTAAVADGYNTTLLTRELKPILAEYEETLPYGYSIEISGESTQVSEMLSQIIQMALLGFLFIYLIMVAQFQSLKSPFIVIFTIPLAFTGGMLGLLISGQQLSILSLMGFIVLMGTVVNNGIVFVDYANQLRLGGLERQDALCAAGRTRMRPIIMTALTTILALSRMIFGSDMGSQLGSGMSVVIAGGLLYATLTTLYIIPIIYDIFFKRQPLNIDTGDDLEAAPDDAAEYLRLHAKNADEADAAEAVWAAVEDTDPEERIGDDTDPIA